MLTKYILENNIYLGVKIRLNGLWDRMYVKLGLSKHNEIFESVQTCCLFIGYPRSGHSIIGSIIDAHPNSLMAHRLDALKYIEEGYNLPEVFYFMLKNSERFAQGNRKLTGYQYNIPNQWQGRFDTLSLIGDQEGNWSTRRLAENPALLQELLDHKEVKFRFIHVVRNPFDNITTWALRTADNLESRIEKYFHLVKLVHQINESLGQTQVLHIRHEAFLEEPQRVISGLLDFLDLEASGTFIEDCTSIIYQNPNKSRHKLSWSKALIHKVEQEISKYPLLEGYTYDS